MKFVSVFDSVGNLAGDLADAYRTVTAKDVDFTPMVMNQTARGSRSRGQEVFRPSSSTTTITGKYWEPLPTWGKVAVGIGVGLVTLKVVKAI